MIRELAARLRPNDSPASWVRGLLVSLAAAAFLSLAGAFGSGELGLAGAFAYWAGLLVVGYVWGSFLAGLVVRHPGAPKSRWAQALLIAALIAASYAVVVGAVSSWALGAVFRGPAILALGLSVFAVSLVMTALNMLVQRHADVTSGGPSSPRFLERLPLKLRGAEVWAVEADDHYLRLHTSMGQDLILLRLADAIAELEGIEGAQVHRSWWVARDAVVDARRGDGRAVLTLKDGSEVPVSRTYARLLRERGWI
jgi:DNA-binding LytR/AlgR family response regulator